MQLPESYMSDQQYYFGGSIIAAPVAHQCVNSSGLPCSVTHDIFVPEGEWTDMSTGELVRGPAHYKRTTPLAEVIPASRLLMMRSSCHLETDGVVRVANAHGPAADCRQHTCCSRGPCRLARTRRRRPGLVTDGVPRCINAHLGIGSLYEDDGTSMEFVHGISRTTMASFVSDAQNATIRISSSGSFARGTLRPWDA